MNKSGRSEGAGKRAEVKAIVSGNAAVLAAKSAASPVGLAVPVCKIATFHLNGLADLLFTLPALSALREGFPGAKICAVMRPALAPLMENSPYVDEILMRPKGGLSNQTHLMLQLRAHRFDVSVAFSGSRITTMLAWGSGAPARIGFESARMENLLTDRVPRDGPPRIESHLELVRALGCRPTHCDYSGLVHLHPKAHVEADRLLAENNVQGPFVVVGAEAGAKRTIKEWPAEKWAAALDKLAASLPVVLVGAAPATAITASMKNHAIDLGGRTDLPTLAALCGRARFFVGIDSGIMHLAAAMKTPVVGIFGPTDASLLGPRGVPSRIVRHPVECSPCMLQECKWKGAEERKCLTRLDADNVVGAARDLVGL